jgi:tyrosinase
MQKPAKLDLPGAKSRFDEFQATHQLQAYATHFVGAFLPFHRAMLYAHEEALRNECGYDGWQPYWQEQLDAGHFLNSIIFDPVFGFGGDGSELDHYCITNGPFANYINPIGPAYEYTDHCIERQFNESFSALTSQQEVDHCLDQPDWLSAWPCIEANPHLGGHAGVGGEVRLHDPKSQIPWSLVEL